MNPITLPVAELKSALTGLGKVINQKATLPVLHHIKVERTNDGWIALTGTDLDRFVTMRLEHPAEGPPTAVLIPYEQLAHITRNSAKDERIHIESSPEGAVIRFALADKTGESKVKHLPATDFPQTPRIKADAFPLPAEVRQSIHEAMDCASVDSTRYVLNGTFIDASNPKANYIVATDGRHLYSANSFTLPLKQSLIIPSHKFLGWKEFNLDGEWQMKADKTHVQLSSRRWRFIAKQIEGPYPNYRNSVPNPRDDRTHISIDPAKLEALIKLIQRMPCHSAAHHTIGLEWKQGQLQLLGKEKAEDPWLKVAVPDIKGEGPEMTILFDRRFLTKALQFGLNTISLIDEITPLRFHAQGKYMIVMPLRHDGADSQPSRNNNKPTPVNAAPLRAAPPPALPPERKPMITQPSSEGPPPGGPPPTLEEVIDATMQLRDKLIDGANQLRDLSLKLKFIHREQKTSVKDFNTVRTTLRSLQSLKL